MKLKTWITTAIGFVAPSLVLKAQQQNILEKPDTITTTQTIDTLASKSVIDQDTLQLNNSYISIPTDSLTQDTLALDSAALAWSELSPREKLNSCSEMMLLYIAQFEDVKSKSYYDSIAHKWTIGPGLTRIKGRPVTSQTRIHSTEEMYALWREYCEKPNGMFDAAEKYLPLDLERPRTAEELALCKARLCAMMDVAWNVGNGFFGTNETPAPWLQAYISFLETGDSIYLNKCGHSYCSYNKKTVKINGRETKKEVPALTQRRELSWKVFTGDVKLSEEEPTEEQLAENTNIWYLQKSALGDAYRFINARTRELIDDWAEQINNPSYGKNFNDTIQSQFRQRVERIPRSKPVAAATTPKSPRQKIR